MYDHSNQMAYKMKIRAHFFTKQLSVLALHCKLHYMALCSHFILLGRYTFLTGKGCFSIQNFRVSRMGRTFTHYMLTGLECVGVVPKGSTKIHEILLVAADSLTAAGKRDIFTPMLKVVARKPTE